MVFKGWKYAKERAVKSLKRRKQILLKCGRNADAQKCERRIKDAESTA